MSEREELSSRVKTLRLQRGMKQEELAVYAQVSRQTLSDIENGRVVPQEKSLRRLLEVLGVDLDNPSFEPQTELWLSTIGTLIEAIPESNRARTVNQVIHVLGDGLKASSNVTQLHVGGAVHDEDYDVSEAPDFNQLPHAAKRGTRKADKAPVAD